MKKLEKVVNVGEFSLIFESIRKFSAVMAVKAELGKKVFDAYKTKDKKTLLALVGEIDEFVVRLDEFTDAFDRRYTDEYFTHDVFVCGNRLGGLRLNSLLCKKKIIEYVEGKIPTIEILDEQL